MKGKIRFISSFLFVTVLFLVLLLFAFFQGGFTSWFLFYSFLPIYLYQLCLLFYPIKNWRVSRELSKKVFSSGENVDVVINIQRKLPFPLYYCICEEVVSNTLNRIDMRQKKYVNLDEPDRLHVRRSIKKIVFPWFRRHIKLAYRIEQIPRGRHELKTIRIKTGDIFGLIKKEYQFNLIDELVAYPIEHSIRLVNMISSFEQGSISSQQINFKNTNVATGIREYAPGDKFSWIDWKQTAKSNNLMSKEFEQEKSTDTLLVLDGCFYDGLNGLAFDAAVEMGISLMETLRKQASQVGLLSISEETVHFPVQHDPTKMDWVRNYLARLEVAKTKAPFAIKLKEELKKVGTHYCIIIIVTNIDIGLKEALQQINLLNKTVNVIYIQAKKRISSLEHRLIQKIQQNGITFTILTEEELIQDPIEVKIQ